MTTLPEPLTPADCAKGGVFMNGATIRFKAQPATSCRGCLFEPYRAVECRKVCAEAAKRGLPDCDDAKGYIYVADEVDPRQLSLEVDK